MKMKRGLTFLFLSMFLAVFMVHFAGGEIQAADVSKKQVGAFLKKSDAATLEAIARDYIPQDVLASVLKKPRNITLAVEHFSPIAGASWCGSFHAASEWLAKKYPWLKYIYQEGVGPDSTISVAEDFIKNKKANIVVSNAEFMALPIEEIYEQYPDVYFMGNIASDIKKRGKNWIRYFGRQYQAQYLAGMVAGAITETNSIGLVCAFPAVQVVRKVNAFTLGVKATNPKAKVYLGSYVGGWYDPPTEREVGEKLVVEFKVDVLSNPGSDSSAPVDVAKDKGIWFIGKDADIVALGWATEKTVATSYVWNWQVILERVIADYVMGKENPRNLYFIGMEEPLYDKDAIIPVADIVNNGRSGVDSISAEAKKKMTREQLDLIAKRRAQMLNGKWDPFEHYELVNAETGKVISPAGEMPTDEHLLSKMNYYIPGVVPPGK